MDPTVAVKPGNCVNFDEEDARAIFGIKISLGVVAILTNLLVIGFIFYSKKAKDFMYRLILYMLITDVIQAVAIIWIILPVDDQNGKFMIKENNSVWHDVCVWGGFFSMTSLWMGNIVILWIVLYLVWVGWNLYRHVFRRYRNNYIRSVSHVSTQQGFSFGEFVGIILLFIVPFIIAAIPFAIKGGMYGLSGPWCWVKLYKSTCNDLHYTPFTVELAFFYGPLVLVMSVAVVFVCVSLICCCRGEVRRHDRIPGLNERRVKEIAVVLACPLLYCAVTLLLLINRIKFGISQDNHAEANPNLRPYRQLWIAHSLADPFRVLLPAIAILVNPFVWRDTKICCKSTKPRLVEPAAHETGRRSRSFRANYGSTSVNNRTYVDSLMVRSASNTSLESRPM